MKIAFVVHDHHRSGGHSRYVAELADRYAAAGHEIHIFANTFRGEAGTGIRFHRVPAWRANAVTTIVTFFWNASQMLRLGGFDIVHDQGLCCARKDVITAHICNAAWTASRRGAGPGERVFGAIVGWMERQQYARARLTKVIAVSGRVREDLARWYGFRAGVSVIYHGVDAETFSPDHRVYWRERVRAEMGVPQDAPLFLFVGDLRKGAEACIRALGSGWLACVSGTPAGAYRAVAAALGCEDRVVFCPASDVIERYYAAADVFLLPTPYDAFGMVVLEAMAAGVPAIVGSEAGAAELIEQGVNGWKLDAVGDLAAFMETALTRADVGIAGRSTALQHSWERVAEDTMQVYRSVRANG